MRYFGNVGYAIAVETVPGVWEDRITEETLYGDVIRDVRRNDSSGKVNDNLAVSNTISVLASPFALTNFQSICYVEWLGTKWKVSNIEVQLPRLILSLGGVYNGPVATSVRSGDSVGEP